MIGQLHVITGNKLIVSVTKWLLVFAIDLSFVDFGSLCFLDVVTAGREVRESLGICKILLTFFNCVLTDVSSNLLLLFLFG